MIKVLVNRQHLYISVGSLAAGKRSFLPSYEYDTVGFDRWELSLYWYKWFIHFNNRGRTGE